MAAQPMATPDRTGDEAQRIVLRLDRRCRPVAVPRAMTRCECAGMTFDEIARQVSEGRSLPDVLGRTGCGQTCGACLPDLSRHLAPRG